MASAAEPVIASGADAPFADDYRSARARFLDRCHRHGLAVASYRHPLAGPDGAPIHLDAARIGAADARHALILVSGTHGVEGYAGSNAQVAWLDGPTPATLPGDTAVLLVHMLNPWGAAWRRRHNEDNIDLNRHFIDRGGPLPANAAHADLVRHGFFDALSSGSPDDALSSLTRFRAERGEDVHAQAVFQGQYDRPEGLGFGGTASSWSQRTLETLLPEMLVAPEAAAFVDLHTGLGPFGTGTIICTEPPEDGETAVLRRWYDADFVALLEDRQGLPYALQGDLAHGVRRALPGTRLLPVSLEFGTFAADRFADLMVRDAWAERRGDPGDPDVEAIRCDLMHFFYPRSAAWRGMVAARSLAVADMALAGLRGL